ncbi:ATP-dependent DNA ligase [Tersicoccus phoenicis]|uniref:DNA ligase (ATP) n=1 Tax=Tersicoccus phoenicis TaxID=554083 RepID=A0A1R1LB54_9MICC|nr:ATP-dependent DNA ligase [Tersicoccus phoenicis]OMH24775.1 ATP-dependent DNA ligase [Tersicoccus phoenicis]
MAAGQQTVDVGGRRLRVSNLGKVLYPATGTTKAEVLHYYAQVAHVLIPQAAWRPVTRKRWVNGVGTADRPGQVFFRKDLEDAAPAWIPRGKIEHRTSANVYPLANEPAVLAWFGQLAALEIHTPQWRFDPSYRPRNPDRLVLDLDPGPGAGLPECAEVARLCRQILDAMGLDAVPVTSGSKGIHLYAQLDASSTSEQVSQVAHELARALEADHPDLVVSDMKKTLRAGKVLVDWSQNNANKTTICPYSLRGREHPTVAAPRTWAELEDPDLAHLSLDEVLERVAAGMDPIAAQGWVGSLTTAHAPTDAAARHDTGAGVGDDGGSGDDGTGDDGTGDDSAGDDLLATYRAKRDAGKTPEPVPQTAARGRHEQPSADSDAANPPTFVIQEHHARRLHWDFRLEHAGVLVSWAVPKGPPLSTKQNRLAVRTEDHPLEYGTFAGTIPKGEYGGGEVTIWDHGTYELEKWRDGQEVIATVTGQSEGGLGGVPRRFAFIRATGMGGDAKNWLLHLMKDQPGDDDAGRRDGHATGTSAKPEHQDAAAEKEDETNSDHAAESPRGPGARDAGTPPAPSAAVDGIAPMLATAGAVEDLRGADWAFEMKWDGVRVIATVTTDGVTLAARHGADITTTYPELVELADRLDPDVLAAGPVVLDGEVVALAGGRPDFGRLQNRMGLTRPRDVAAAMRRTPVHVMLFDVLHLGGRSLLRAPYRQRRELLAGLVREGGHVHVPEAFDGSVDEAVAASQDLRLEGVVAKKTASVYQPGQRARTWIKLKNQATQEVVVIGWRHGRGGRTGGIGSLLVAVPDDDGVLHYAGRVGTGFTDEMLSRMSGDFAGAERKTPAAADVPAADGKDVTWLRADRVGEVGYGELTRERRLRHPVWRGWRPDKDPAEVRWEAR